MPRAPKKGLGRAGVQYVALAALLSVLPIITFLIAVPPDEAGGETGGEVIDGEAQGGLQDEAGAPLLPEAKAEDSAGAGEGGGADTDAGGDESSDQHTDTSGLDADVLEMLERLKGRSVPYGEGKVWKACDNKKDAARVRPSTASLPLEEFMLAKHVERRDWVINQGNHARMLPKGKDVEERYERYLPGSAREALGRFRWRSCAVVGNSGSLKFSSMGAAIDSHDVVMRLNQAPTAKYEDRVGSKTTFRMFNRLWADEYGSHKFKDGFLPLETNVTLLMSRGHNRVYYKLCSIRRLWARDDVELIWLPWPVVAAARRMLLTYRVRMCKAGYGYGGSSSPSSGYLAIYLLLNLCESVTTYGFGRADYQTAHTLYHYYEGYGMRRRGDPVHSFGSEEMLVAQLAAEGRVKGCAYLEPLGGGGGGGEEPHLTYHNHLCGYNIHRAREAPGDLQALQGELGLGGWELEELKARAERHARKAHSGGGGKAGGGEAGEAGEAGESAVAQRPAPVTPRKAAGGAAHFT